MWIQRFLAALMVAVMLVTSTGTAFAEPLNLPPVPELVEGEPDVGEAISPMKKGQKAPFTGVLLSPAAVAKVLTELKYLQEKIDIEVQREVKTCTAECTFKIETVKIELETDKKILQAKLEAEEKQNKILVDRVKKLEKNQPNVLLWSAGGAVVGVLTTIAIVFAVSSAENATK